MAYKQKAEDLQNISRSMKNKASYGPGGGDPPVKTTTTKGDENVAKEIIEAPDPTEGMDKLEKAYYNKQIGSRKLSPSGEYIDDEGYYRDGKTDKRQGHSGHTGYALQNTLAEQARVKP